ncbi:type II toxin-antitoxin system Phd/YefM family antitoxin [Aequorivita capsosiphonis]|uniref:type II toxin-antitoxin system Phd/YefM family antitoxin n=1 Tax=Aequorivita capsosiphonis TaxID=487317 RepID=UPI00041D2607|nr:type II toxin-antitoxin system prevent-host-death family antitoxin [Aequorivita capsosiphonis]
METTNATDLRKNLKEKLDKVSEDKQTLIVHRSGQEDVVMVSMSEYNSWKETLYLLSTKANRKNLEASIAEMKSGKTLAIKTENLWK